MEHVAFGAIVFLLVGLTILREREYIRHRKREAALTDQVIQLTSTKRWEDYTQLRKDMFLAEIEAQKAANEQRANGAVGPGGMEIPPEVRNQF